MKIIILILIILQFIWFPQDSNAALKPTVKQQVELFYAQYHKLHPKDKLFVDILNLNMKFEMTPEEKMSEVERIYRGTRLWQSGAKLITSLDGMLSSEYEEFVKYLSDSYFTDVENRPAISLLSQIITAQYFGEQNAREHYLKENHLLPHFLDASVKWGWAAAGAWWLFGGGKGYKVKVPGKIGNGAQRLGDAIARTARAVHGAARPKNPGMVWTAGSVIFKGLFVTAKTIVWSTPKFIFKWRPLRELAKGAGVLGAVAGGPGIMVGYPNWVLYQNGYGRKSDLQGMLEQGVYDLALVKLACDVDKVKKSIDLDSYQNLKDPATIARFEKDSENLNEVARALNNLLDVADYAMSPYEVTSAVTNNNGIVTNGKDSFECEALRNAGSAITVSLVHTRDTIAHLVSSVVNKINEMKFGAVDNPVKELVEKYKQNSVAMMTSKDKNIDNTKVERFIESGVEKEAFGKSLMRFLATGTFAQFDGEWYSQLLAQFQSLTPAQQQDFHSVAKNIYMSLSGEELVTYILSVVNRERNEASGRATVVGLLIALHLTHEDLAVMDSNIAQLPSPLVLLADMVEAVQYVLPETAEESVELLEETPESPVNLF